MASRFGERFFVKARLEKRRNTVCISSFSNYRISGKDPAKREDAIVRCCHKKKERSLSVLFSYSTALFRRAFCRLSATMRKNDREVDKP